MCRRSRRQGGLEARLQARLEAGYQLKKKNAIDLLPFRTGEPRARESLFREESVCLYSWFVPAFDGYCSVLITLGVRFVSECFMYLWLMRVPTFMMINYVRCVRFVCVCVFVLIFNCIRNVKALIERDSDR